jgi:hypothetical protein
MGFHSWLYVHDMNVLGLRLWRFGFVSFRSKSSVFVNKQFSCFRSLLSVYVFVGTNRNEKRTGSTVQPIVSYENMTITNDSFS